MKVELLSHFGNDLMVVNAARVSYGRSSEAINEKDIRLISYLKKHGHVAPFKHPQIQFRIECPIFVERQLFKHQIGLTANSISGRYVDFSDNYHEVTELRKQSESSKQGSEGVINNPHLLARMKWHNEECARLYADLCAAGVAKEQARIVLPLALETQFVWTGSLLAYFHLFNLRLKPDAQQETREVASEMLSCIQSIPSNPFEHSLAAFGLVDAG